MRDERHLDALQARLVAAVPPNIAVTREHRGGVDRLAATRRLDDGSERSLEITWIGSPDSPDAFSIMGGWYRNPDRSRNTDGRQYGSAAHTLRIVVRWLVEPQDDWVSLRFA